MHEGRFSLIKRLTWQVGGNRELALKILRARGHVEEDSETLTEAGRMRDFMTAAEREIDRGDRPGSSNRSRPQ